MNMNIRNYAGRKMAQNPCSYCGLSEGKHATLDCPGDGAGMQTRIAVLETENRSLRQDVADLKGALAQLLGDGK